MASSKTGFCDFGWKADDFALKGVDGKTYTLADVRGPKGTLVVFICNHCPYVKAVNLCSHPTVFRPRKIRDGPGRRGWAAYFSRSQGSSSLSSRASASMFTSLSSTPLAPTV